MKETNLASYFARSQSTQELSVMLLQTRKQYCLQSIQFDILLLKILDRKTYTRKVSGEVRNDTDSIRNRENMCFAK